jgi:hypothetical protein
VVLSHYAARAYCNPVSDSLGRVFGLVDLVADCRSPLAIALGVLSPHLVGHAPLVGARDARLKARSSVL